MKNTDSDKKIGRDAALMFYKDQIEKSRCTGHRARPLKKKGRIYFPMDLQASSSESKEPWWKIAPPIVHVDIASGEVLTYKWPLHSQ